MKNIFYDTLKNNLCIGCGICSVVCPNDSIRMEHCDENWERPVVDGEKCVGCGKCIDYCPHTFDKVRNISREIATLSDPKMFGLNNAWYYIANVRDDSARISSASGGIASYLIKKLLSQKKADVVIHGEMLKARTGELHYGAAISRTLEDVDKRKSSFYSVFSFNKVLDEIRDDKSIRRICITGVPCIIRAIKNLIQTHSDFAHIDKVYSIALSCSHNVTGAFIDYLADSLRIDRSVPYYVNLRNKDDILDANSFNNHFFSDEGTIVKINRFDSEFTLQWRNYSFSLNACNCCSDFWGEAADISVKDAWGKWASEDPLNRNILVVRSEEINQMLLDSEDIVLEKERLSTIYDSQDITSEEKMADSRRRCKARSSRAMARISFNHRQHDKMRRLSFKLYGLMQKSGYNASLNVKAKKASDVMVKLQKKTEKNINRNKRKKWYQSLLTDHNKILVVGGYGRK